MLFDFDGPVCSLFAGYPAAGIACELLKLVRRVRGRVQPGWERITSPHQLLLAAADDSALARRLEGALRAAEMTAVSTATPTPGAADAIAACTTAERRVAIVSNNCRGAITAYLERVGLTGSVCHVEGRSPEDPRLMKPSPYVVERAIRTLGTTPAAWNDVQAGRAAGVATVGYANKVGKAEVLRRAGADTIVTDLAAP
ncbi:HAD family hydrolase [Kribbella sp. NPDC051587]|uniref:HAD family hydrolase n=1 Tax=Kribbella sp. NPDC051587 TaxID=3364119 RepID=UPI0037A984A0